MSSESLHGDRLQQLHCSLLGGIRHRGHLERGTAALTDSCLAGIAHDGAERLEQRANARNAVNSSMRMIGGWFDQPSDSRLAVLAHWPT